jgi:hypothetical protein
MKKKYRVAGPHAVLDHRPGSTFEAEIPADQEARLLERGSLIRVTSDAPKPSNKEKKQNG